MDEEIVLDRKSFEALAVETRIRILKSLKERRKTLSEIATEQKMSVSGIKEHLETLEEAGLIEKKDDGHKWKYYELTKKGAGIVAPRELRVWILLSISMIALLGSMLALTSLNTPMVQKDSVQGLSNSPKLAAPTIAPRTTIVNPDNSSSESTNAPEQKVEENSSFVPMLVGLISGLTMLICLIILVKNRITSTK